MRQTILNTIILLVACSSILAQETPQDLGKTVFDVFKTQDYETLDKLTPKANEILEFYRKRDSTSFVKDAQFKRKYISRDSVFKEKCIAIMMGQAGVDFKKANLIDIKYSEKPLGQTSSGDTLTRNYLEIYFLSENKKYSLQFRSIRKIGKVWKLGESVRIKEEK